MSKDIGSKTRQGVLWTVLFDSFEFVLNFASSIILARLLFPEDFGLMSIASIAIQFARRLANFGFSTVLVQLKEVKDEHYDTVYIMNLALMALVCAALFFGAPFYADFFNNDKLNLILRIIAFDFLLKAFASVPTSILRRYMNFRLLGMSQTIGKAATIFSTVALAIAGAGVWSLVFGTLIGSFAQRTAVIHFARRYTPWRPGLRFRWWAMKEAFAFGAWVYAGAYVNFAVKKIDFFLVGKFLGAVQLGFYERAFQIMSLPRHELVHKINSVLFSGFSRIQDDDQRVVKGLLRVVTYLSIISYPLMIWLFFVSPSLIRVVYGEKWVSTVYPLQVMCLSGLLDSFTLLFQPVLRAKGLIGHNTRRDFMYLIVLGTLVYVCLPWGIDGVAWGVVAASVISLGLMLQVTMRKLPLTLGGFLKAQQSAMIYGFIQIGALLLLQTLSNPYFGNDSIPMLIAVSALSLVSVLGAHLLLRFKDVDEIFFEFLDEGFKFARKLPVLGRLGFLQKKMRASKTPKPPKAPKIPKAPEVDESVE